MTLESVEVGKKSGKSAHALSVSLIYPRSGIASRTSEKRLDLVSGSQDWSDKAWSEKILFKEQVEGRFGIVVEITESLTAAKLKALRRYVLGGALRLGGDALEDIVPVAGDVAALPLDYYGKNLQKATNSATIWLRGVYDLSTDDLVEGTISIPLVAAEDITKSTRKNIAGGRAQAVQTKVVLRKGSRVGELTVKLQLAK